MKQKHVILIGKPGSGKGTISDFLVKNDTDFVHLSTGNVFREHIQLQTSLGLEITELMNSGEFVDDELTIAVVEDFMMKNPRKRIIFDGFPRTENQLIWLSNILIAEEEDLPIMLVVDVDDKTSIDRIMKRYEETMRSEDSDISKITKRIQDYNRLTFPLIELFDSISDNKIVVDGTQKLKEVFKSTLVQIQSLDT